MVVGIEGEGRGRRERLIAVEGVRVVVESTRVERQGVVLQRWDAA